MKKGKSLPVSSARGVMLCLGIRLLCFSFQIIPVTGPSGRGNCHHPRGEPGPGIPGHRSHVKAAECSPCDGYIPGCRTVSEGLQRHGEGRDEMTDADIFPGQQQRLLELMTEKENVPHLPECVVDSTTPQLLN